MNLDKRSSLNKRSAGLLHGTRLLQASLLLSTTLLFGCEVDPYCLSCGDSGLVESMDASTDASTDSSVEPEEDGSTGIDASTDGGMGNSDACLEVEFCNDLDDDCDGFTDEDFDLNLNPEHCGECNNFCSFVHAFSSCQAGTCEIGDCDVGFINLNGDDTDGCEYRCLAEADDDSVCDLRDNDCDGMVDEDVPTDTDPVNCGRCGRVCRAPHGAATCAAGECTLGDCETGFHDIDGRADNGCEYACTAATPSDEVCNSRDDDCDGRVDEGSPGAGVACGIAEGACTMGTTICTSGRIECDGSVEPVAELCNGLDDDCDGEADEGNPEAGRVCGTSVGACEVGFEQCVAGALSCVGAVDGTPELCNNLDDNCDGQVDEANPEGGAACGETAGECAAGMVTCRRGALVCEGNTGPIAELCNGLDDDCDGTADNGNPEAGALCGTDVGRCVPGNQVCSAGVLTCSGEVTPITETCNGIDDNCDGSIDEGNPDGGAACGETTGACTAGALSCRTGVLICEGAGGPMVESCNGLDDDCDGTADEDFSFDTDVNNCGGCGTVCSFTNAAASCVTRVCTQGTCDRGFHDIDPLIAGCEYACDFRGAEVCNGVDDNCDGQIDEPSGLFVPSGFCNPNGVCATTEASCGGAAGWVCNYPAATFQETETRCDGMDNDCNGLVDDPFPLVGDSCFNGIGQCRQGGNYVCNGAEDGVVCNAATALAPADEDCNGIDDDCDGSIDETAVDDPLTSWRDGVDINALDTVTVDLGGGATVEVMAYEASRPDASSTSGGTMTHLACSRPDVEPWTNVTWDEAQNACCALNEDGTCPGAGGSGWRLCEAPDWQQACEGPTDTCEWSYGASCDTSQQTVCNGAELDCDGGILGDQDCRATTGSPDFPMCYSDWGAQGRIYDLSGNTREWTATNQSGDLFQVRGGSYNSIEPGRRCDYDFTIARRDTFAPNTGFRCCMY